MDPIQEDKYGLLRDFNASTRLTAQHYLWKEALGFTVHPSVELSEDCHRVDVATGNGLWLLDTSRSIPAAGRLHGFDTSLDQCPQDGWLPDNVRFHRWDVFDEPPAQFLEKFDLVRVRLVTVVVQSNDPSSIIGNLRKLLSATAIRYILTLSHGSQSLKATCNEKKSTV
ncbi:MAG: hypothetical protein MMC23_009022 [Stictis urceolatum]|nr:hypothetical protein [Stictis urceolata]